MIDELKIILMETVLPMVVESAINYNQEITTYLGFIGRQFQKSILKLISTKMTHIIIGILFEEVDNTIFSKETITSIKYTIFSLLLLNGDCMIVDETDDDETDEDETNEDETDKTDDETDEDEKTGFDTDEEATIIALEKELEDDDEKKEYDELSEENDSIQFVYGEDFDY